MSAAPSDDLQALQAELRREKRVTEAGHALHASLDLDAILALILASACDGVGAERGTVYVMSADGSEIWSRVLQGDETLEIRLPLGRGLAGSVAQTGASIRLDDAYDDPRFDRSWDEASNFRTRQLLCQPIRNREGATVGVIQLLNKRSGSFGDDDEAYIDALSIHAALALENAQHHVAALERERQTREIQLAQDVQRAFQPEESTLEVEGLQAAGLNVLCEDASGDYYDFVPLSGGRHALVVGDVSGHGLKSALVMAQARAFLRAFLSTVEPLADVFDRLDDCLCNDLSAGTFMTLFVAIIDPATGHVEWSSAGNPRTLLWRARDGSVERLGPTACVLGVMPGPKHVAGAPVDLEPGDMLLLYTDGATEARAPDGEMFTEDRLATFLAETGATEPGALLVALGEALRAWTQVEAMDDDLTLLAARRT